MKTKKLLSFVVLSAFAALAQMVRADEVTGYFYDGITNIAVVAEASSVMSNFTIKATQVNKKLPGGWNVVAAYNLWSKSEWYRLETQDLIVQGLKDGYLAEATYSWSDSDLIISGKSGFDSFALLCEPILYGITFDPNFTAATEEDVDSGMDPMEDISYADTTTQLDQNVYERVGYDFAGWTTDAKNKKPNPPIADQAYVSSLTAYVSRLVTSLTLYAKWTPHTYTIEYDDNKGTHDPDTASRPTSADYDKAFEATNPTRTGYVFTGWVLDGDYDETSACYGSSKSSCSTPFSSSDNGYVSTAKVSDKKTGLVNLASEDGAAVSLVAQWRPLQINVVINEGNATNTYVVAYDSISDEEDYQALPITTPERAGYVFNGWKVRGHNSSTALYGSSEDSDSCTTPFPADGVFPADIGTFYVTHLTLKDGATVTFTAQWRKIDNYTIVYDENGGTAGSSRPTEGSYNVALKISNPKMTGYTFAGWALSGDDSDLLTARYSTDGETYSKFENGVAKPAEDSAYNYIYVKNLASKDGGVSVTLIAQWTPNTANVTIDDGAETSTTTALKYGATLKIEPPKKDGSTFIGWKTTGISTTTACYGEDAYSCENPITDILDETNFIVTAESFYVKNLTPNDGGAVTFLARWKTTYYNVSVNWNDGEPSTKKWIPNKVYDEQIFIQAPTRSGYTFKGWKISGGYDPETISYGMDENTITVSPDGQKIETFSDLYFKNMASEDGATVILTAQWTANTATVVIKGDESQGGEDQTVTNSYGDVFTLAPTNRTGYTFIGWDVEGYGDTALYGTNKTDVVNETDVKKIAEVDGEIRFDDTNTTVYAKNLTTTNGANVTFTPAFNPIVYNIVYDDAGGTYDPATAKRPPTAVFDGEKFLVTAPTRDDYVFIGWNVSGGYDTNTIFSVVIDDETSRDVTFDGTTLYTDRDIWFRNMASTSNATVTLTALWTQVSVSVTIDGVTQTNDYSKILPIEVPEKDGYVFDGWKAEGYDATTARYGATTNLSEMAAFPADGYFPASLGSFYVTHLSMTDGAIITFTSQWKPISYKIVYDEDGGTAGRDRRDSADYDEAFKVYKPTRTGYAFAGWELSGDCNLETASSGTSGGQCTPNFSDAGIVTTTSDIYFKNLASATNATVTLKALWTAHTTTVTTDINGTSKSDTATYDEPMLLSVNPPTGYVFHGWKVKNLAVASALYGLDEDSCTNSIAKIMTNDTYVAVTQDIYVKNLREDNGRTVTFTADLEAIPYAVTCAANGGEPVASWPTNAVYDKAFLVTKPARTGYAFSGWALSGDYDTSTAVYGGSSADCSTKFKTSSDSAVAETSRDAYFKNLVTTTNSSVTLTAQWTANATTVIIDRNGTETQLTLDYDKLQKISPDPIEDGYGFHGWNVNGFDPESALYGFDRTSCTNKFPADGYIAVTRDIYVKNLTTTKGATVTFTAKLTPASYTIEYDVQDGTLGAESPTSKGYADEAFCVSAPTRTGYAFAGWKIDGDFDAETARYGEIKARCTSEIPKNNKIETTGDIWFAKLASEDGSVVKLIAQWTANKATYVTDIKGTQSSPQEASYGTPLKLPVPDAGKGYAFKGWQVEGFATNISCYGESEQACTNAIPESGIIATSGAVWVKNLRTDNNSDQVVAFTALLDPISYQLVYKEEGGILGAEHPDTATYDVPFFVSAPTQKGYTFMGWKVENYDAETACYGVESNACTTAVTNDAMTAGGDLFLNNLATVQDAQVVLTATWDLTAPSYDVEYVENGGGGHDRPHEALKYGTAYLVSASARTGYEFTGWSVFGFDPETAYYGDTKECVSRFPANGNLDVKTDIYVKNLTMIGQKITFTAKWNVIVYGLKYSDGEGTELNCGPETNAYDNVVAIKPPTKANSRFVGWTVTGYSSTARYGLSAGSCTMEIGNNGKIEQSGTIYVKNLSTEAGETVQFTALWETPSCAITYKLDGGSIPAGSSNPATITYGSPVLIKAPTKSTTTFIGWKVVDCGDEALWGDDPDNAASCTNAIPADGVILAKGDIWIKNFLATSSSASATMTALWEADWSGMYTVVFNSNDGASETSTQKIAIGVKTALTSNTFVRTGYTFQGWAKAPDATAKDYADGASVTDLSTTPGAKIDLYAVWQANTYTVEFFANGGYGKMDSVTATYDKLFTLPANKFTPPANSTFVGWYRLGETYEAGATVSNLTATADGIVTLSAQWSTTTTDLSKAMDCTNLSWENLNPKYAIQWVVTNDVGHGTSSCVCQQNGNLDDRSPLIAQLKASSVTSKVTGTLKFWWKPSSSSAKLQWATSQKKGYVMDMTEISAEGPDWQEVTIEIDSVDAYYLILENDSDAVTGTYEYIDAMSWEVPDVAIAPTTVNAVQSLSMASPSSTSSMTSAPESSDAMTLSFTGDERFAYRVLYKDDLTEKDWHVLETVEIQNGTGGEQAFTVPRDNTSSRFYTIETIQK